jgi:MSHA biogenesis protein MshP
MRLKSIHHYIQVAKPRTKLLYYSGLGSELRHQNGSMVIMALFLIVVVGLLASTLISVISASSNSTIHQVYGVRAQQAAQTGVQNLLQASFPVGGAAQSCDQVIVSPASMSNSAGLQSCSYSASCVTSPIAFANVDYLHFRYTSTGTCVVDTSVISRTVSVDAIQELQP